MSSAVSGSIRLLRAELGATGLGLGGILPGIKKPRRDSPAWAVGGLAMPYFRMANGHTSIGAGRFHFRVRDGIGLGTPAMVTKRFGAPRSTFLQRLPAGLGLPSSSGNLWPSKPAGRYMVKPHGQLVPVCCTHRCASTPGLSTSSSPTALQGA